MISLRSYIIIFLAITLFGSCSPDPDPVDSIQDVQFSDVFQNVVDNIIVPRYSNFHMALSDLDLELNNFDSLEMSSLVSLQQKLLTTYLSWQKVSAFEFGPAAETSALLRANINSFTTLEISKIELNIQNNNYNLDAASNYSAKGLPALDYILFHASQDELLLELADQARVNYMKDCVSDMISRVDYVLNAWDAYRNVFINSSGNDQSSSLSLLFNNFLYDYEQIKRNKFALPAGFATSYGVPLPMDTSKVEGLYSATSLQLIYANLTALENLYLGVGENDVDGVGIYEMLKAYNANSTVVEGDLSEAIANQFVLMIYLMK